VFFIQKDMMVGTSGASIGERINVEIGGLDFIFPVEIPLWLFGIG